MTPATRNSIPNHRQEKFEQLSRQVRDLEANLERILRNAGSNKCDWPTESKATVKELQYLAAETDNQALVRGRLDKALAWPNIEMTDPKLFLGGKPGFEQFDREDSWFEDMGFSKYQTPYTFSDRWDKRYINATFLVSRNIDQSAKMPIMWFFHGGGFCTGAGDFIPWYSKTSLEYAKSRNAIIIAPDYPLGPMANYRDIAKSIKAFLTWFKKDQCFEEGYNHWTEWLSNVANLPESNILRSHIFVEGESAGGHAAVTALFLNADMHTGDHINIKAVLLRYPMIKHYARSFPDGGRVTYMGTTFSKADVETRALEVKAAVEELEKYGLVPTRTCDHAPHGMSAAFLLSMTKLWQGMFQRHHYPIAHEPVKSDEPAFMDGLERAVYYAGKVEEEWLAPIIIYHGHDDANCPVEDTEEFVRLLTQLYPQKYIRDKTVFLEIVTELKAKPTFNHITKKLESVSTSSIGHGFDYSLDIVKEGFLKRAYERIHQFWT